MQIGNGRGHHAAVRSLAFKWIGVLFACWNRTPYDGEIYLRALQHNHSRLGQVLATRFRPSCNTVRPSCRYRQSIASRTMVRRGTPGRPLARNGLPSSSQAVPAISRCTHGVGSANSFRNMAAVTAPP